MQNPGLTDINSIGILFTDKDIDYIHNTIYCPPSPFNSKSGVGLRRDILLSAYHNFCEAIPEIYSLIGEAEWWGGLYLPIILSLKNVRLLYNH